MSRKNECLKQIAEILGAECTSNDNTTCEILNKIANVLPGAMGGGTLKWVYKEEISCINTQSNTTINSYRNKILYLESDYYNHIITCVNNWPNDLALWANEKHDMENFSSTIHLTMNTNGTIIFQNKTTTGKKFKIYELVVA